MFNKVPSLKLTGDSNKQCCDTHNKCSCDMFMQFVPVLNDRGSVDYYGTVATLCIKK